LALKHQPSLLKLRLAFKTEGFVFRIHAQFRKRQALVIKRQASFLKISLGFKTSALTFKAKAGARKVKPSF